VNSSWFVFPVLSPKLLRKRWIQQILLLWARAGRRLWGRSLSGSTRPIVHLEKYKRFSGYSASTLSLGNFSVGTSSSGQRSRPAWSEAEVGRCRRDRCQNQWGVIRLCAAIDLDIKLILRVYLFRRHDIDPATVFPREPPVKHDLSDAMFFVDGFGYQTALAWLGLSGGVVIQIETWSKMVSDS